MKIESSTGRVLRLSDSYAPEENALQDDEADGELLLSNGGNARTAGSAVPIVTLLRYTTKLPQLP